VALVRVVAFMVTVVTGRSGIRGRTVPRVLAVTLVVCVAMVIFGPVRFSIHFARLGHQACRLPGPRWPWR
jgi:hypothetical protein